MVQLDNAGALQQKALMDHFDLLTTRLQNMALSPAGLAIGSVSKKTMKIVNTITYLAGGVFKSKTTAAVPFTATTDDITNSASAIQEACYLVSIKNSDASVVVTKGTTAGSGLSVVPDTPTGHTPVAYAKIAVAAGATPFDATSDDLDAAHLTVTYVDLGFRAANFGTTATV